MSCDVVAEAADVKAKVIFTENQRKGAYMQSKRIQSFCYFSYPSICSLK